jgi:hypothetical protein
MAATAGVFIHPYILTTRIPACAFCFSNQCVQTLSLKEQPTFGWYVCPKEECHRNYHFCVFEHERRRSGRSALGNSREPIRMFNITSSDDED